MRLWIADTIAILLLPVVIATISLASFYNGRVHGEKEAAISAWRADGSAW